MGPLLGGVGVESPPAFLLPLPLFKTLIFFEEFRLQLISKVGGKIALQLLGGRENGPKHVEPWRRASIFQYLQGISYSSNDVAVRKPGC